MNPVFKPHPWIPTEGEVETGTGSVEPPEVFFYRCCFVRLFLDPHRDQEASDGQVIVTPEVKTRASRAGPDVECWYDASSWGSWVKTSRAGGTLAVRESFQL